MDTVRVDLAPKPGFCVKTSALQSAVCRTTGQSEQVPAGNIASAPLPGTLLIPQGMKVFVNIAWDANVPPPPEGNEEAIQRAMAGEEDIDEDALARGEMWFVPVVVSEPRSDVDKAGKASAVFDCVYNSSLKSRTLRDPAFRAFLIELGLQRIEAQHSISLSRNLGTPNIAAKGKLAPRSVRIPLTLFPAAHPLHAQAEEKKKNLIVEIEPPSKDATAPEKPKGILKSTPAATTRTAPAKAAKTNGARKLSRPRFEWTKEGQRIKVTVHVPELTRDDIPESTLDIEPRRIVLDVPSLYHIDIDLSMPDAQIVATFGGTSSEDSALMLKRQREFDIDGAEAEWRVQEGIVVIYV